MIPVRIIYLINGLGSGGAEMMLYRLLERIDRKRFQPEVIALLDLKGPIKSKIESLDVHVFIIGMKSKLDFPAILRLAKYLKKNRPQILHTQLFAADIIGRFLGRLLRIPVIVTSIRNSHYGGKMRDLLLKWTDKFALKTTFVSHDAARRYLNDAVVAEGKAMVIHNGLEPSCFERNLTDYDTKLIKRELAIDEQHIFMLVVGSLTRQKGYELLFESLKILKRKSKEFHLVIAGEGELKEELFEIVGRSGLSTQVSFIGHSDDVAKLMAAADLLVLSSHWEGLPGVVMEAMASSLPVVATSVGGTPELIVHNVTGYLVPPGNPGELAAAIAKMIGLSAEDRAQMGIAGRDKVEQEFNVSKMVKAYEALYTDCLKLS